LDIQQPNEATTSYIDFLLEVARGSGVRTMPFDQPVSASTVICPCCPPCARASQSRVAVPTQGVADILAAMAPCSRLYGYLGCSLNKAFPNAQHPYAGWIQTYCSPAYLKLPAMKERVLDRLGGDAPAGATRHTSPAHHTSPK
jgi:thiaminase